MAKFYNKKSPFCRKVQDWMKKWQIELAMLRGLPLWEHEKGTAKK